MRENEILVPLDGAITMLWTVLAILVSLGALSGCRDRVFTGDHPRELVGTWQLLVRSSCDEYGIKSDRLILRADGTFDQHVVLSDGKQVDLTAQHWRYMVIGDSGNVTLENRLEFFTPEYSGTRIGEGVPTGEMLIVEGGSQPVILLHPDSDCVYDKVKGI